LTDAKNESLNPESRFDLAYNAAHALSLAALRRAGYRSHRRYVVFQSLTVTLGVEDTLWRVLDRAHQIRNVAEYEGVADISISMINAVIGATDEIARRQEHGELR
jgi:VanZ family protein